MSSLHSLFSCAPFVANGDKNDLQKGNSKQGLQLDGVNNVLKEFLPVFFFYIECYHKS